MWILTAWILIAGTWKPLPLYTFSTQGACLNEAVRINSDYSQGLTSDKTGAYCKHTEYSQ